MGIFKADFLRSLVAGFLLGTAVVAVSTSTAVRAESAQTAQP